MNILITGGAGFIGSNTVARLAALGHDVTVYDNLSRRGASANLEWLQQRTSCRAVRGDVRDAALVADLIKSSRFDVLIHLAAQVAVTTSVLEPREDFEVNALGTLNVLEAVRRHSPGTAVLYACTNKVYGALDDRTIGEAATRYTLADAPEGVSETERLQFYSPYGCSKGAAEQYTLDYARVYGLRTVSFRQSCIYGERQFGVEDQGWVAWFAIAHYFGDPVTVYGTGKQVRDLLWVDDLTDVYITAMSRIDEIAGQAFNVGGGPANTLSVNEVVTWLGERSGRSVAASYTDPRPGDQKVFVSANRLARHRLGWAPKVGTKDGLERLWRWIDANRDVLQAVRVSPQGQ